MTSKLPAKSRSNSREFERRLTDLKQKLIGFSIVTNRGESIGTVKDLIVDADQRLTVVVSAANSESFFIKSRSIDRVYPRSRTVIVNLSDITTSQPMTSTPDPINASELFKTNEIARPEETVDHVEMNTINQTASPRAIAQDVVQEETIRLIEERLRVNTQKHKVGEVIVRKEIETEYIQVPVRREKLIVEQISLDAEGNLRGDRRQLAQIDLGHGDLSHVELIDGAIRGNASTSNTIHGEFGSPQTVTWLFDAIARQPNHGCKRIRIELELDDASHAELYQGWFDRSAHSKTER